MVYPAMIWLETNGQQTFVLAGMEGIRDGLFGQGEKTKGALVEMMEAMTQQAANRIQREKEHISECGAHDGDCGCGHN